MKSRWLVTGANGFLGWNAPPMLGNEVDLIAATRSGEIPAGYSNSVALDLLDVSAAEGAIRATHPQVILHTAALANHEICESDPVRAHQVNALATGKLAAIAATLGAQFVYISTDAVFNGASGNYVEDDETSPFSVYGETKLQGEWAARGETPALIVRTNFFGWSPSGNRSILEFFINSLKSGRSVSGYTDFIVTSIYARTLISTIRELLELQASGTFHVASADAASKYEFGIEVARQFGLDESLISAASAATGDHDTSRVRNLSLNTQKLTDLLGRKPETQKAGILHALRDR